MRNTTTDHGDVLRANLSSALEWRLWAFGSFEPHFAEPFSLLVRPGDRCVDVGANIGLHTVRLAELSGGGAGRSPAGPGSPSTGSASRRRAAVTNVAVTAGAAACLPIG
jgi:hypothetical protein